MKEKHRLMPTALMKDVVLLAAWFYLLKQDLAGVNPAAEIA